MKIKNKVNPAVLLLAVSWVASADVILTAGASPNPVNVGSVSTAVVTLSDNASSNSVAGFQFDIDFKPTVLQATFVTEEGYFANNGVLGLSTLTIDNTAGTITLIADAAATPEDPGKGDPLVDIAFNAIAPGSSPITITNVTISNAQSTAINSTTANTSIDVRPSSAVPEPATGMLAAIAMFVALCIPLGKRRINWCSPEMR